MPVTPGGNARCVWMRCPLRLDAMPVAHFIGVYLGG